MTIPLSLCKEPPGKASGEFREKADASGGQLCSRRTRTSARMVPTRMLPPCDRNQRRQDPDHTAAVTQPAPLRRASGLLRAPRLVPCAPAEHQEPTRRPAPFPNANDPGPCQLRPRGQSPAPARAGHSAQRHRGGARGGTTPRRGQPGPPATWP